MIKNFKFLTKYSHFFKNTFLYLSASIISATIGILLNPFMALNLSHEDYAIMGYFNSFNVIILPITNFSLITYYLRNYYKLTEERRQIVSDTILIALTIYGLFVLVIAFIAFYIYSLLTKLSFPIYPFVLLAFVPIYLNNFITLYLVKCRLKGEAGRYTKITIFNALINALFALLLVIIYKYGATGRMTATVMATLLISIYSYIKMFNKFQFDWTVIKDALKFGWPLSLSAILWYFLNGVDRAMLEKLGDNYTFGFYNVGIQIGGYMTIFYTAIAQTFEPDIYKAIAENNKRRLIKIIGGIITLNAIPNILFIFFAPFIIGILTYNRYTEASSFAQILAISNITITFYYSAITIIVGYGFTKSELLIRMIGAFICFIMFKFLISSYGFYGAAWGQVFSYLILTLLSFSFLFYQFKTKRLYDRSK